jgi:hypothetical protein
MHMMEKWTLEVDGVALFSWEEKAVLAKGTRLNPEVGCFGIYALDFKSRDLDQRAAMERGDLELVRPSVHA